MKKINLVSMAEEDGVIMILHAESVIGEGINVLDECCTSDVEVAVEFVRSKGNSTILADRNDEGSLCKAVLDICASKEGKAI